MKSVFRRFCVIILVMFFLLTGCGNILRIERESQRISTYILEPETCISLLGCNPEDAEQVLTDSYWIEGNFQSANVDEEGNLVLRLSQGDIQHWKNYILDFFELRENLAVEDGTKFIIADDYKSIESYTMKEIAFGSTFFLVTTSPFCGIMQMLCGEDPNGWYVDVRMYDFDTKVFITSARMPYEKFEVTETEWDAAIRNAEEKGELSTE